MQKLTYLSQPRVIWTCFIITIALTISFGAAMQVWQFEIIDEMFDGEQIRAHLAAMSAQQKQAHIWVTATLDVAYPFAYASLFIGLTIRAFPAQAAWLILPSVLVVPVDLTEGFAQVMLLSGDDTYMPLKLIMTPTKLSLFIAGFIIAIAALIRLVMRKRRSV